MAELGLNEIIPPHLIPKEIAIKIFRNECMAWRLAKTICKPKYWNEEHAIEAIKSMDIFPEMPKINWNRIKVISLCDSEGRENLKEILSNLQLGELSMIKLGSLIFYTVDEVGIDIILYNLRSAGISRENYFKLLSEI
jgi:hypothetical protein